MNYEIIKKCLIVISVISLTAKANHSGDTSITYLDNGGVMYVIEGNAMLVEAKNDPLIMQDGEWLVFKRNVNDQRSCIISTEKIYISHAAGHVVVFPEFKSKWLGAIDPCEQTPELVVRFMIDFNTRHRVMDLTTEFYNKRWVSEHKKAGNHFYIGELEQVGSGTNLNHQNTKPLLSILENVNENDEFKVCVSHISAGTELRLRSFTIIIYPFREEE